MSSIHRRNFLPSDVVPDCAPEEAPRVPSLGLKQAENVDRFSALPHQKNIFEDNPRCGSFCDSGVSLASFRSDATDSLRTDSINSNCLSLTNSLPTTDSIGSSDKTDHGLHTRLENLRIESDPISEELQDDQGITLEQLHNRPIEQKIKDLESLDWRSQDPLEPKNSIDEGICNSIPEPEIELPRAFLQDEDGDTYVFLCVYNVILNHLCI